MQHTRQATPASDISTWLACHHAHACTRSHCVPPQPFAALDAKARSAYKTRALACLHVLNNTAHVLHALGASRELKSVGEGWAERYKVRSVEGKQRGVARAPALLHNNPCTALLPANQTHSHVNPSCARPPNHPSSPSQGKVEDLQRAYIDAAWGPLLALLRQDAAARLPPNLAGDKAARAAIKERWVAVNRALAEASAQQVRQARGRAMEGPGGAREPGRAWQAAFVVLCCFVPCRLTRMPSSESPVHEHMQPRALVSCRPAPYEQAWVVPDAALRFALKDAVGEAVLPLFQAFFDKYRTVAYTGEGCCCEGRCTGVGKVGSSANPSCPARPRCPPSCPPPPAACLSAPSHLSHEARGPLSCHPDCREPCKV